MRCLYYIVAVLMIVSMSFAGTKKEKPKVSLTKAQNTTLERTLLFPASIKSTIDSKIISDGNFIVLKRLVSLGQKVKKNDPLLIMRHQDRSIHYENRILRAPVSGTIASILVEKGQYIRAAEELLHINKPEDLYARLEVSAADYLNLKKGLQGKLKIASLNLKDVPVEIAAIGTAVDQLTGTVSVELKILGQKEKLVPGVIGMAEITLNKEEVLLVKEKSLYYIGEDIFVAKLDGNKVIKTKVKLGGRVKDKMEVISGLELGESYIPESAKFLRDGEEVQLIEKK